MSNENYETQDLCLAAAMQCFGNPVTGVEVGGDGRATFYFEDVRCCKELVEAFWRHKLQVEPRTFFNALKTVKARLYAR
jgi:hypothetical protein